MATLDVSDVIQQLAFLNRIERLVLSKHKPRCYGTRAITFVALVTEIAAQEATNETLELVHLAHWKCQRNQ